MAERPIDEAIPDAVRDVLRRLWTNGHAAYVVGGSVRDVLLGREPYDWDLATDARPERVQALFPGAVYENRFGTVAVRVPGHRDVQITTFRQDHDYADFRRPHRVEFGDTIESDLARRDFTVNAMAWGAGAGGPATGELPVIVDPHGGRADAAARILRAVGDPRTRFEEDALRMIRAVRLSATLGSRGGGRDAGRDPGPLIARQSPLRASGSRRSSTSCWRPRCRRSGFG